MISNSNRVMFESLVVLFGLVNKEIIMSYNFTIPQKDQEGNLYLHALPYTTRKHLCVILDEKRIWSDLAVKMQFDSFTIQEIKQTTSHGKSPSDKLITLWSDYNHTVVELFFLLKEMRQWSAMKAIKESVNHRYHKFILESRDSDKKNEPINRKIETSKILNVQSIEDNVTRNGKPSENIPSISQEIRNLNDYAGEMLKIEYKELVDATNNWNESNKLGRGGYGTVYKGKWKMTDVAIKKLEIHGDVRIHLHSSLNELKFLNSVRHDNILPLFGYSISDVNELCLICQLMLGGSLEQRLPKKSKFQPLTWKQRLKIAKGAALGLQFLHTFKEKPLIHGDIKPANILLDANCEPKIGDFGLTREGPMPNSSFHVSQVFGTRPYLPAEFILSKHLSTKVDTFSFGVVLYELLTGLEPFDSKQLEPYKYLTKYVPYLLSEKKKIEEIMDPTCPPDVNGEAVSTMLLSLGLRCTSVKAEKRPEMKVVYESLLSVNL